MAILMHSHTVVWDITRFSTSKNENENHSRSEIGCEVKRLLDVIIKVVDNKKQTLKEYKKAVSQNKYLKHYIDK